MRSEVEFVLNPKGIAAAVAEGNKQIELLENRGVKAGDGLQAAFNKYADLLLKASDRSRAAMESQVKAVERLSASYGKTGLDKIIAQRDHVIKQLGGEQDLIKRVADAYGVMIDKAKEAANAARKVGEGSVGGSGGGEGHGSLRYLILGAKDIGEGRTRFAAAEAINYLQTLKGAPLIIGGVIGGFLALAAAGAESVGSLAKYGVELEDIKLKTGLTTAQVEQFRFAFKSVGQDIGGLDRINRGLTQALEDNTREGDKAREALQRLGVATLETNGQTRPLSDILLQISQRLNTIPTEFERNKVAIDLFKRAGLESIPVILELSKNIERAKEIGLSGPSEEDERKFKEYNKTLTEASALWGELWRNVKGFLASVTVAVATPLKDAAHTAIDSPRRLSQLYYQAASAPFSMTAVGPALDAALDAAIAGPNNSANQAIEAARRRAESATNSGLEGQQDKLKKVREDYEKARTSLGEATRQGSGAGAEAIDKRRVSLEQATGSLRKQEEIVKELSKDEARRIALLEKTRDLIHEGQGFYQIGSGRLETIVTQQQIEDANRVRRIPSLFGPTQRNPFAPQLEPDQPLAPGYNPGLGEFVSPSSERGYGAGEQERVKAFGAGLEEEARQDLQLRLATVKAEEQGAIRILELRTGPGGELATAQRVAQIRSDAISEEYKITNDLVKFREASLQNELDQRLKIAEIEEKQFDGIKHTLEGLYGTLFTKPGDFGKQLGDTLKSAALRPITEGLASTTARFLQPIIYGQSGAGGIAGGLHSIFGGGKEIQIAASRPLPVYVINAGGGGSASLPSFFGGGGGGALFTGGSGDSVPSGGPSFIPGGSGGITGGVPFSSLSGLLPLLFSGSAQAGPLGFNPAAALGPGGTSGFAGPISFGGGTATGGNFFGGLRGLFHGGTGLSNLGGFFGIGNANKSLGTGSIGNPGSSYGTSLSSIARSPGAGAAGFFLAQRGLLGANAGSALGVVEGTAGGALIGEQYGGPVGAAIGAGIGFGIGIGEVIAGVEPQWKEAERLVKKQYGINIDQAFGQKIADIANSKYGGRVSIAVTAPDVRQMLGLYAAGTGQKIAADSATPHGASLLQQGGKLYQSSTTEYGNRYAYNSGLPIAGGYSAQTLPNPGGGPQTVVLNLNGQSAADLLEGRVGRVATPAFIQDRWAQAANNSNGRVDNAATLLQPGLIQS